MKKAGICLLFLALLLFCRGKKVYGQGGVICMVKPPYDIPVAVVQEQGNLAEGVRILDQISYTGFLEQGEICTFPVVWDFSKVNVGQTGVYQAEGRMELPQGYSLGTGVEAPKVYAGVSVQKKWMPEINAYYKMSSAGLFVFPWLDRENEDMQGHLKREGSSWISLDGYAMCERNALYLSDRTMRLGNIYELAVTYGDSMTKILRFLYTDQRTLEILSYRPGTLEMGEPEKKSVISSLKGGKGLERCLAFAIPKGGSLEPALETLKQFRVLGSTSEKFEDTPENPAEILEIKWDTAAVNRKKVGVYKMKGEFQCPEGFRFKEGLKLPEVSAYISVQKIEDPQIHTYYMPREQELFLPMVLKGFTEKERKYIEVYVKKNDGAYRKIKEEEGGIMEVGEEEGITIYCDKIFEKGNRYSICAVHPKGSTGIYSFIYTGSSLTKDIREGRDFSDREEKNLPPIVQMEETVTDTTTVVSGDRLSVMIEDSGEFLTFEKNGISLFLPSETAAGWNLGETEKLQVILQQRGDAGFSVHLFVRGEEIKEIPGAKAEVAVELLGGEQNSEDIHISDAEGNLHESSYLPEEKSVEVLLDTAGDFERDGESPKNKRGLSERASLLSGIVVMALAGAVLVPKRIFGKKRR